jgi:hypothetical protein
LVGNGIQAKPEQKGTKEVTIKLPSAIAKENNHGTIASAQKAGQTTKSPAKPNPKPRQKLRLKPGTKRKQTEVITSNDTSNGDASNDDAGNSDASEPVPLSKSRAKR